MSEILFLYGKLRTGRFHTKGGGFVEDSAIVPGSVHVGPMCKVLDAAQVLDECKLTGQVIVCNEAIVSLASQLSEHCVVRDQAQVIGSSIGGYAVIKDQAIVTGSTISGNAVVRDDAISTGETLDYYSTNPCDTGCATENNNL